MTKQVIKPTAGDTLIIDRIFTGRVKGEMKETRKVRREETAITAVYSDGRVATRTGDVWHVKPFKAAEKRRVKNAQGKWITIRTRPQFITVG